MAPPNKHIRRDVLAFAVDYQRQHGTRPTIKQAAVALGVRHHAVDNAVRDTNIADLFDIRSSAKSADLPRVMPKITPRFRRKWAFWGEVVRTLYPDRHGERS